MKKVFILLLFIISNASKAQMIKTFDCIKVQEDSNSITYNLKVKFDSTESKENLLELVKLELERNYKIKNDKIVSIDSFIGKRYLTHQYKVKVKKETLK